MKFRKTEMVFSWKTFLVFLCTVISEIISVIFAIFHQMHWFNLLLKWLSFSADACVLCSLLIKYRVSLRNIRLQKQNACKCNFIWTLTTLHAADVEIKATVLCLPVKQHHQYWLSKYQFHFLYVKTRVWTSCHEQLARSYHGGNDDCFWVAVTSTLSAMFCWAAQLYWEQIEKLHLYT